jgi:hypothetical protein
MKEYVDKNGCAWDSEEDYFFMEVCGFCGCSDREILDDLLTILDKMANDRENCYYTKLGIAGPEKYIEALLGILDNAGLIEHGTAIRGSWLTEAGGDICKLLKLNKQNK